MRAFFAVRGWIYWLVLAVSVVDGGVGAGALAVLAGGSAAALAAGALTAGEGDACAVGADSAVGALAGSGDEAGAEAAALLVDEPVSIEAGACVRGLALATFALGAFGAAAGAAAASACRAGLLLVGLVGAVEVAGDVTSAVATLTGGVPGVETVDSATGAGVVAAALGAATSAPLRLWSSTRAPPRTLAVITPIAMPN
jgi:hypothetical protein